MLSWKIGDVKVSRLVELEIPVPYNEKYSFLKEAKPDVLRSMPWLYPHFVTEDGALLLSIHALLVEAPGMKLIVDTCVGNDKARKLLRGQELHTPFVKHLSEAGFGRDEVDAVVCTHLHVDHVGWNTMRENGKWVPTFPKARYLIGRAEYEHWSQDNDEEQKEILDDSVKPIFDAGLAEMVEMDHRISPELRLMPSTGHTPGHVSVVIEFEGRNRHHHRRHDAPSLPDRASGMGACVRRRCGGGEPHAPRAREGLGRPTHPHHRHAFLRPDRRPHQKRRRELSLRGVSTDVDGPRASSPATSCLNYSGVERLVLISAVVSATKKCGRDARGPSATVHFHFFAYASIAVAILMSFSVTPPASWVESVTSTLL